MATDIGAIKGLIELQDNFTGQIGLAKAALSQFSKENQQSLTAVAGAAGLVAAAVTAIAVATIALGDRGSDINDVNATLVDFAGGAQQAAEMMEKLRAGTQGTVSDFLLAKNAAHLLSAGVKLTADEFGVLGEAAFVLQNRGLGATEEMLKLVSDAMVTGRTRALAMSLGVIDAGNAEEEYAKKLGIRVEQLSDAGRAEAKRVTIMDMLSRATAQAGEQERDFGEQLEWTRAQFQNYLDQLAQAVAASPVFTALLEGITDALSAAFSAEKGDSIKNIVTWIEQAAMAGLAFASGLVEVGRVGSVVWQVIETAINAVLTATAGVADLTFRFIAGVIENMGWLGLVSEETVQSARDTVAYLDELTAAYAEQTVESAKGIVQQTEFDKTLNTVQATVDRLRGAMAEASKETEKNAKATDASAEAAKRLAAENSAAAQSMIDRAKVEEELLAVEKKSVEETKNLWAETYSLRVEHGASTLEAQKTQIQIWFDNEVDKLEKNDRNWQKHYDALKVLAGEKLDAIMVDWDTYHAKSIDTLRDQALVARNTYNEMLENVTHFTRDALEEQRQKVLETSDAARGLGKTMVEAQVASMAATQKTTEAIEAQKKATEEAARISRAMGGSYEITKANLAENARYWRIPEGLAVALAQKGFSFQEIIAAFQSGTWEDWIPAGPRIPGFKEGGTVDIRVGEGGMPEVVRVPLGSTVYPANRSLPGSLNLNARFEINYPILNDRRSLEMLGHVVGQALMLRATNFGTITVEPGGF